MHKQLFPQHIDNSYSGYKLALFVLAVVTAVKTLQCVLVQLNGYSVVKSADGVPLDAFPPAAAQTVVAAFAAMGISRLLICVLCALVLVRYRSVIVPVFGLLLVHDILRETVLHTVRVGTPIGVIVNSALIALLIIGISLAIARPAPAAKPVGETY